MRLIQGDCLKAMDELIRDGVKFDAIVTDPPYLIRYRTSHRKNKQHDFCSEIQNDESFDFKSVFSKCDTLLNNNSAAYIFGSWKTVDYFRALIPWNHKNNIVWVKNNWTAGDLRAQYGQQYELIMYYNKGRRFFNGKRHADVWNFNRVSGKAQCHQNQKPVDLIEHILLNSTNEGDTVIDPFMGSGSTGVACKNLNRDFVGIELEEKYFNMARDRIYGNKCA